MRHHVIVDLEATCWRKGTRPERMEVIEIGAVKLEGPELAATSEFDSFVRPIGEPVLSDFCTELTGIRQEDVDSAEPFPDVWFRFLNWVGKNESVLCSWGDYDRRQLELELTRHSLPHPPMLDRHVNLKRLFAERSRRRPRGLRGALHDLSLEFEGSHHRGIDDARNVARVARYLLRNGSP